MITNTNAKNLLLLTKTPPLFRFAFLKATHSAGLLMSTTTMVSKVSKQIFEKSAKELAPRAKERITSRPADTPQLMFIRHHDI